MQVIQTYAEYLPERFNDPDFRRQCCEALQSETGRIGELIKQLMEFSKPKKPALRQIEPHRILDSTLELLNNELVSRQIHLKKEYQANGTQIQVDPDQFRQVILNLILNALQAVSRRGLVTVKTWRENGWFTMEVADTGPGIAPEVLAKLFQPFTTTKEDGTGLGLSIASDIIKEHGGKISAQNHPGRGASFLVRIPAL